MTNARKTWWYAVGQTKVGPCSSAELMDLVTQGKVFPDTLVWKEGMANWVSASRIKGLWQNLPATPPAAPPLPAAASASSMGASMPLPPMPQPDQQFGGFTPPPAPQASNWPDEEEDYEEDLPAREEMTFKKAVERCFKKYFDFSGRAGRAEFWYFYLFNFLVALVLGFIGAALGGEDSSFSRLADFYNLVTLLPSLAVATRRLHDTGRSGWWQLIYFTLIGILVLIFWWIQKGDDDANEYGYPE